MLNDMNELMEMMDTPPSKLQDALELAQDQINKITNKEKVYKRMAELIELD